MVDKVFFFWEGGPVVMGKVNNLRLVDEHLLWWLHFITAVRRYGESPTVVGEKVCVVICYE